QRNRAAVFGKCMLRNGYQGIPSRFKVIVGSVFQYSRLPWDDFYQIFANRGTRGQQQVVCSFVYLDLVVAFIKYVRIHCTVQLEGDLPDVCGRALVDIYLGDKFKIVRIGERKVECILELATVFKVNDPDHI